MNHAYRVVWNAARGVWQAASELARAQGKASRKTVATIGLMLCGVLVTASAAYAQTSLLVGSGGSGGTGSGGNYGSGADGGIGGGGGGGYSLGSTTDTESSGGGGGFGGGGGGDYYFSGNSYNGGNGGGLAGGSGDTTGIGGGGDTDGDIGGNGSSGTGSSGGTGAGTVTTVSGTSSSPYTISISPAAPYTYVGVGGGGGGSSSYSSSAGNTGGNGADGYLTVTGSGVGLTLTSGLLVGGGGGGGGGGGLTSGGAGGEGTVNVDDGATLSAATVQVGAGGGGGGGGGNFYDGGGAGGSGTVTLNNGATLSATTLQVGGDGGGGGGEGSVGGSGGSGQVTVSGNSTVNVAGSFIVGGYGGDTSNGGGAGGAGGTGVFDLGGGSTLNLTGASFVINGNGTFNLGDATASDTTGGAITGLSSLVNNGAINFNQTDTSTISANLSGSGKVSQNGSGTTILSGANSYTGATTISGGTLEFMGDTSQLSGNIADNGALVFDQTTNSSYAGVISGLGSVTLNGLSTVTLSGANTYTGGTTISGGTLALDTSGSLASTGAVDLGSPGATLSLSGSGDQTIGALSGVAGSTIDLGGNTLTFGDSTNETFAGNIVGTTGSVNIASGASVVLDGVNTYTGLTTVASGATLAIGDSTHTTAQVGGDVSVDGGTLGGYGVVAGSVTLSNGATLAPGGAGAIGTLTVNGDLTIGDGSNLDFDFGSPGPNYTTPGQSDSVVVSGNLSIGTSTLNVSNLGSMGPGLYNLFDWGESLSIVGGGFTPPPGMSLQILTIDKEINLVDSQALTLNEWDANGQASANAMGGGSGTWSLSSDNWANTSGQFVGPMSPEPAFTIFGGASGEVTVDDSNGDVSVTGMQFVSDGYHLTGNAIDLVGQNGVAPVLRVSSGDTAIIDDVLDGTGGLNKTDGGTLVLTGNNTYQGTTTLSGGYLSVSSDANLGQGTNALDFEGGTLEITGTGFNQTARNIVWGSAGGGFDIDDAANTFTVAQTLAGTGGLLKSGAGTLLLSGQNSYSGDTVVSGGTLQLQGAGTLGASSGATTVSGGTLDLGGTTQTQNGGLQLVNGTVSNGTLFSSNGFQLQSGTVGATLAGSGSLVLAGPGMVTLSGNNTYTGATQIASGATLAIAGAGSIATSSGVTDDGTLDISGTTNGASVANLAGTGTVALGNQTLTLTNATGTFAGALTGSGKLAVQGNGSLIFNGNSSSFTGTTEVASGLLEVGDIGDPGAVLGGSATVDAAATLRGHGTVAGDVTNNGTVMPGGTIGTLSVGGNYTQAGNATLAVEVSPTAASQLKVTGNATLGGTLALTYDPGTYTAKTYTLLSAGSVSGKFGNVASTGTSYLGSLAQTISYDASDAYLTLAAAGDPQVVAPTSTSIYTATGTTAIIGAQAQGAALLDRLGQPASATTAQPYGWINATGSDTNVRGTNGEPGFQANRYGFLAGLDHQLGDYTVGVAAGYDHTDIDEQGTGDSGTTDTLRAALYGSRHVGPVNLAATLGAGLDFLSQKRPLGAAGTAEGDHMGQEMNAGGQASLPMTFGSVTITPRMGLRYAYFHANGFSESGAGGEDLNVGTDNVHSLQPYVGVTVDKAFGDALKPVDAELRVGYAHEMLDANRAISVGAQDGTLFTAPGTTLPRGYLSAGASITMHPKKNLDVSLSYDTVINTTHASAQQGSLRVGYQF